MAAQRVTVGYIHPGDVSGNFCQSLVATIMADRTTSAIGTVFAFESSPRIAEARTTLVRHFLEHTNDSWLLMIDADMAWTPDDFTKLRAAAHATKRPIVAGLCFAGGRSVDEAGFPICYPTLYHLTNRAEDGSLHIDKVTDYPDDTLVEVTATGAAYLMVHRDVFTTMADKLATGADGYPNPYPWFAEVVNRGRAMGEDITFCVRARAMGFPIHVHTGVKIAHRKHIDLTEVLWRSQEQP